MSEEQTATGAIRNKAELTAEKAAPRPALLRPDPVPCIIEHVACKSTVYGFKWEISILFGRWLW